MASAASINTVQSVDRIASRSSYHLTPDQIQFFDDHGYLILRNWIPQELLQRLQDAGQTWIDNAVGATEEDPNFRDYVWAKRPTGKVLFRVNYVHNKGQAASLELLVSPQVLAVAESLCGPNIVPTYESMVFKQKGDGEAIPWHQDAVHPRNHRIFSILTCISTSHEQAQALYA